MSLAKTHLEFLESLSNIGEARDKVVKVYKFDELNPKAKQKVLNKFRERNWNDSFLVDQISDSFKENLKEWGLVDPKVYWSLSGSQGDGVAFEGYLDLEKFFKGTKFEYLKDKDVGILIKHSGRYYHSNSMDVEFDEPTELTSEEQVAIEKFVKEAVQRKSWELEKQGYSFIEYYDSEEAIKEMIDANDYEFYANGDIAHHEDFKPSKKQVRIRKQLRSRKHKPVYEEAINVSKYYNIPELKKEVLKSLEELKAHPDMYKTPGETTVSYTLDTIISEYTNDYDSAVSFFGAENLGLEQDDDGKWFFKDQPENKADSVNELEFSDEAIEEFAKKVADALNKELNIPGVTLGFQWNEGAYVLQMYVDYEDLWPEKEEEEKTESKKEEEEAEPKEEIISMLQMMDRYFVDNLKGGKADKEGKKPSDFQLKQVLKGILVELEHADDEWTALEIALDHLTEDGEYYDKLETIHKD